MHHLQTARNRDTSVRCVRCSERKRPAVDPSVNRRRPNVYFTADQSDSSQLHQHSMQHVSVVYTWHQNGSVAYSVTSKPKIGFNSSCFGFGAKLLHDLLKCMYCVAKIAATVLNVLKRYYGARKKLLFRDKNLNVKFHTSIISLIVIS